MIRVKLYLKKYDWLVHCYIAVDCYYTYEILDKMRRIGASRRIMADAHKNLLACQLDTGLCYSNPELRESVWVTSLTSEPGEFLNSIVHEIRHLQQHIANECGLDNDSEEVCYLCGNIAQELFKHCHFPLCPRCRCERLAKTPEKSLLS